MKPVSRNGRRTFPLIEARDIHVPLRSVARKLILIVLVALPAVILSIQATRIAMAARLARRLDVRDLRHAIALDPGNAAYEHKLGLVYAYSFDQANLQNALRFLRRATELNPRKALYWSDLAEVCDTVSDTACSNRAVERALSVSPMTPRFEWKAGNHDLQTGQTDEALRHFRRLLALDDNYAQPVFHLCRRVGWNDREILQDVLPHGRHPRLLLAYLVFAGTQGDIDLAGRVWNQVASSGISCNFSEVKPYLECLLRLHEVRRAAAVWREFEQRGVIPRAAGGGARNLVYNGEFGHMPLDAGFDWQSPSTALVETDFQDPSAYCGSHCLRVDYAAGRNLESEPVFENVPVAPGRAYRLQAYVRSDAIRSGSGPRLRVVDPDCLSCLNVSTTTVVGTTPWHRLSLDFTTGAETRMVRLSVWRDRCRTFPMEITGSFWLDNVSIRALDPAPGETTSSK